MDENWYLYIARCREGSLYVGISKDVTRRIHEHNTTNKCRYTRFRKPLALLYQEECLNYSAARKRESEIKKWRREKKLALVVSFTKLTPSEQSERGAKVY